ncbi:MAG: DUF2189 domain-containing protein [Xanthomonadales bacterium]|nr:DUF2189 domain-containing protein [Xanthomonadales bacterium]
MNGRREHEDDGDGRGFVVPCARLPYRAPLRWLALGWADLRRSPGLSAGFGLTIVLVSLLISTFAWWLGRFALLAALLSGFVFIAPLIGVGLYSVSRRLEQGHRPHWRASHRLARRVMGQAAVFALLQLVIILLWSRAGMMVAAFVPVRDSDPATLVEFLLVGSAVGSVFALATFAATAFSLPMIADRDVDMVTACLSSVNAVLRNKGVSLLWGLLIVLFTGLGFATVFVGLGIVMPWLAYASWHAYRETLDAAEWPILAD